MNIVPHLRGRRHKEGRSSSDAGLPGTEERAPLGVPTDATLPGKVESKGTPEKVITGVVTPETELEVFPDWVEFTFKLHPSGAAVELETVIMLLGGGQDWEDTEHGYRGGYKQGKQRGAVRVYYDGREDMGIHVVMPGEACRQMEADKLLGEACEELGVVGGWRGFLGDLREWGAKFSRFDLATDDKQSAVDLEKVREAIEQKRVVSKFEVAHPDWSYSLETGEPTGKTAYFGHPSSDFRVRMYCKRLESFHKFRKLPKEERQKREADLPSHWVRTELQTRRKHANALVDMYVEKGAQAVAEVLSGYIDFKEQGTGDLAHRYRWDTSPWWLSFLGLVERAKDVTLSLPQLVLQTLETVKLNLVKQWSAWMAAIQMADGPEALQDMAKCGRARMERSSKRDKYLRLVRDYWRGAEERGGDPFEMALLAERAGYAL